MEMVAVIGRVILSLICVLVMLYVCALFMRRLKDITGPARGNLSIVSSLSVGPKQSVVVVAIPGKHLVLGVTSHNITTLAEMEAPPELPTAVLRPSFGDLLRQKKAKNPTSEG